MIDYFGILIKKYGGILDFLDKNHCEKSIKD